jgi:hypothetical protein
MTASHIGTHGVRDPCVLALPRRGCGVRLFSLSGHSLMAAQSATDQRRALELLAGSPKQGCTEAFLLAHGFTVELLADMVRAGLATAQVIPSQCLVHRVDDQLDGPLRLGTSFWNTLRHTCVRPPSSHARGEADGIRRVRSNGGSGHRCLYWPIPGNAMSTALRGIPRMTRSRLIVSISARSA